MAQKLKIALASLKAAPSIEVGTRKVCEALKQASRKKVQILSTPEAYLPGLRGCDLELDKHDAKGIAKAIEEIASLCKSLKIACILGSEKRQGRKLLNLAHVIDEKGKLLGYQAKNQITPGGESENYVPDGERRLFNLFGVKIGIVICHEGWYYPETVRWAAKRGARVIFQPQFTGSDKKVSYMLETVGDPRGEFKYRWGDSIFERAMSCRAYENSVFFASVNMALNHPNSATSIVGPTGKCIAKLDYKKEGLLIHTLDITKADRLYSKRYAPERYPA